MKGLTRPPSPTIVIGNGLPGRLELNLRALGATGQFLLLRLTVFGACRIDRRIEPQRVTYPATMKKLLALLALAGIANIAAAADVVGNAKAAENKIAMCIGCHAIPGYKTTFPEVYQVPMIGGQPAKYIENALQAYKKGERKHLSMRGIATSLSDQDMADIAAYYSQQK